ncbi:MAG TPA: chromate resistance protein ChrB domain-containing protein [Candidatus Eisenbacteria bacterium]|nr:chromate resistance protein ChrB domain-containing protein [Candidatus Eisenbacteria bacterium]
MKVGRRLREIGAVPIKNSIYVTPGTPSMRRALSELAEEIQERGGDAVICEAAFVGGLTDGAVEDLVRAARDAEYRDVAEEARRATSGMRGRRAVSEGARRGAARALSRLRDRFEEIVSRDPFEARGREAAMRALTLAQDLVEGVAAAGSKEALPGEAPRGATWVTRTGVMIDRIASAWLIRRFIDPEARFRFVAPRGHKPARGELRFDMANAEFTHEDGRCTFEVLVERFKLRDSALKPIAEIVHDLDLEDERYKRAEAAGVRRLIMGLAMQVQDDDERVEKGRAVFDTLFESFRRGA